MDERGLVKTNPFDTAETVSDFIYGLVEKLEKQFSTCAWVSSFESVNGDVQ